MTPKAKLIALARAAGMLGVVLDEFIATVHEVEERARSAGYSDGWDDGYSEGINEENECCG